MVPVKLIVLAYIMAALILTACSAEDTGPTRYQAGFLDTFDTFIQFIAYAESQREFAQHYELVRETFAHYHALFDIYNDHDGVNNLKTVNDNAGISPVVVDQAIIELLELSRQAYFDSRGSLDITLGPVLSIWHDHRMRGLADPNGATVPPYPSLRAAREFGGISDLIIDAHASTVFLARPGMSLDVGATAKGFVAERVADMLRERGVTSAIIDAGGDVATIGGVGLTDARPWSVGIRHPQTGGIIDAVDVWDMAAVTSGGYHRAYVVGGVLYHHIIDPTTLMPADNFASITIVHESPMVAEMLSTALLILPLTEGLELAEDFDAAVVWVFHDGSVEFNELYANISANFGD